MAGDGVIPLDGVMLSGQWSNDFSVRLDWVLKLKGKDKVTMFGQWSNGFSVRTEWVLKHKGIAYEYLEEDVRFPTPVIHRYNPIYLEVPILVINGTPIADRLPIHEYIEDVWKQNPLLPSDPLEKAIVRFYATFAELRLAETTRKALFLEGKEQEEQVKLSVQALGIFELQIIGKKFFGGDTPGYLDFILGWLPLWLGVIEEVSGYKAFDPAKFPSLDKWMTNFSQIPVVKDNSPPRDKLVEYFVEIRKAAGLPIGKKITSLV